MWQLDGKRYWAEERTVVPGNNMAEMFWNGVAKRGELTLFRQKKYGLWQSLSWNEVGAIVREAGMGLIELGFEVGETASILGNTRQEWLFSDLALLSCGGVSSGIYPTDAASQVEYLTGDSNSVLIFVEDDEQLDKVLEVRERLPLLRRIVVWDMEGLRELHDEQVISFEQPARTGPRTPGAAGPGGGRCRVAGAHRGAQARDLAILIYTSGTTGKPKGAMLSHANLLSAVKSFNRATAQNEDDERMCFLPLCHVAERSSGAYFSLYTGTKLNFVENPETIPENVREIAPTVFGAVPRVWEKFYSGVSIALKESNAFEQWAYKLAIGIGLEKVRRYEKGEAIGSPGWSFAHWLARVLVLNNVRKLIGIHRSRMLITGAAPISPDLVRWYMALGVPMLEVWGMTETGSVAVGTPIERIKPGSIGIANAPNEVKPVRRGRDPGARAERVHGLPEPAGEDRRDHRRRRLAAHRRRRHRGWRRLLPHLRPPQGHHHHRRRQEHHALGDRKPDQVLALRHRRRGDRRQEALSGLPDHDRPGERREICPGPRRALLQLRQPDAGAGGAEADRGRDRAGQQAVRARRAGQEVPPDREEARRRGRGTDPDHET
jgi:long-chain acyl-CoA synthetase